LNGEEAGVRRLTQRVQKIEEVQDPSETESSTPSPSGRGRG
jgi:hypothetical protein